jgi:hypothetical protein
MSDYQEEVYRMRMERKAAEARDQYQQLVEQYNQAVEARDNESLQILSKGGDRSEYDYWDQQVEEAEQGLRPYVQAQQPRVDPRLADWARRHPAFFERYGQRAIAAVDDALGYIYRPRNETTNNPALRGMGKDPRQGFTPEIEKHLDDVLQMHAPMYHGINFDPGETMLTPNESAEINGQTPQEYNRAAQTLAAMGRYRK